MHKLIVASGLVLLLTASGAPAQTVNPIPLAEQQRMQRMTGNLLGAQLVLTESAANAKRQDWLDRLRIEPDPLTRQEIVTEMARLDQPATILALLTALDEETDASVRRQIVLIAGYMGSTMMEMPALKTALIAGYMRSTDNDERRTIVDIAANFPLSESVEVLESAFDNSRNAIERAEAAAALFRLISPLRLLASNVTAPPALLTRVTERLRTDASREASYLSRWAACRALGSPGQLLNNRAFFLERLQVENSANIKNYLQNAVTQYPVN